MVLNVSSDDERNEMLVGEKENRSEHEEVQRTQKGFQILSERGETLTVSLLQALRCLFSRVSSMMYDVFRW